MNPTIKTSLRLTKAIADTHNNPIPLLRMWKAIVATDNIPFIMETHNIVNQTMITLMTTWKNSGFLDQPVEPYDLDETTLMDQIITDLGETK